MTAKTSDFTGLLYYNPVAHGFNPVVSATVKSDSSPVNEGDDAYVEVITWNIPNDTTLYWRIANLVNMTTDRFSALVSTINIQNNRAAFIINASADNFTAAGQQTYDVVISKTMNGPALATVTISVNDNSQDPYILTLDLDPKNYVPASSSTITVTTTFSSDYAGGFPPPNTGGSYVRYNGDIATQPSVGDTFDWNGTTRTIAQVMGFATYGTSYQYYFIGFYPSVGQGEIGVGQSIDITHGSDGRAVADSSGNNHPGVIHGTVSYGNQGADNAYLTLDGASYIDIPSLQNSAYRSVTMSMWINPAALSGSLITKELSYKTRLVDYSSVSALDVLASSTGTEWDYNTTDGIHPISLNTWHHVTATISPTSVTFYRDGIQVYTNNWAGPIGHNTSRLLIGSYGDGTSEFYTGKIGVTRLYTYAQSLTDVENYYMATAPRYGMYAARNGSHTNDPQASMIFNITFTQNVVGWSIHGYNLGEGITVLTQTALTNQTLITLSQPIMYVEAVYTFKAP